MFHHSEGATALLGMPGFVVGAQLEVDGEVWLFVETTADVVGCAGCGTRAVGHGRRKVMVRDLPAGVRDHCVTGQAPPTSRLSSRQCVRSSLLVQGRPASPAGGARLGDGGGGALKPALGVQRGVSFGQDRLLATAASRRPRRGCPRKAQGDRSHRRPQARSAHADPRSGWSCAGTTAHPGPPTFHSGELHR